MKNKMSDVRDHLVAMLEALGDADATPEVIERAKATSNVANTYIAAVKCELDAIKLHDDIGRTSLSVDVSPRDEPRVLSFEPQRRSA